MTRGQSDERILIVAPTGADANNLAAVCGKAGLTALSCPTVSVVARELEHGCGAILLIEEALKSPGCLDLSAALQRQPPWSDIPVVLIVSGGNGSTVDAEAIRLVGPRANVTLVERPLRVATLLSTLQTALRARRRQYEIGGLLRERDELLASLEQRVADRTAKLETLNADLEAFSYSVSHDLRAPLRALEAYAKILCDDFGPSLPDDARHYAERIAKNAEKMDRLTRDVLTLSMVTRSELTLNAVNLDEIVPDIIDQYPDLTAASDHIEICPPLGFVRGHAPSLTQCFSNLLQNALKFMPEGRTPHIKVYSQRATDRATISVQDNGPGIEPAFQSRIFGIFERASSAKVPGTGIGLSIAKKAVERMGGRIGVESQPGSGARFWIELAHASAEGDVSLQATSVA